MEKIVSFKVDHTKLKPGLYISRYDEYNGCFITTFDLRFITPSIEPPLDQAGLHTLEHLGATYFRNCSIKEKIVYFGPTGCRTGFYLVVFTKMTVLNIVNYISDMLEFVINFDSDIPGATIEECGNYLEHNLEFAKFYAKKYLTVIKNYITKN